MYASVLHTFQYVHATVRADGYYYARGLSASFVPLGDVKTPLCWWRPEGVAVPSLDISKSVKLYPSVGTGTAALEMPWG